MRHLNRLLSRSFPAAFPLTVILISTFAPLSVCGQGGPPLLTDDPETPGNRKWEINMAVTAEIGRDESRFEAPIADINYGLGEHLQLKYEVPFVITARPGEQQSGFDRSIAGVKWRFIDREQAGFSMSTYPQLSFSSPVANEIKNQDPENGTQRELLLPLEAQQTWGIFELNEEIGYRFVDAARPNQYSYGGILTYSVRDGLNVMSELHGNVLSDLSDDELVLNVGSACDISRRFAVLASVGRTLRSFNSIPPRFLGYLGLQVHL